MHCKEGDKPVIEYQFGSNPKRRFKSEYAPIEIDTTPIREPGSGDYRETGIEVEFFNLQWGRVFRMLMRDYRVGPIRPDQPYYGGDNRYFYFQHCIETSINDVTAYALPLSSFKIIHDGQTCDNTINVRCSIVIKHNGNVIYQDKGDCPISADVKCGNCPPHHIECKTNKYPGYCCIGCQSTANSIHGLANRIRHG